jgi:hypothetical protein
VVASPVSVRAACECQEEALTTQTGSCRTGLHDVGRATPSNSVAQPRDGSTPFQNNGQAGPDFRRFSTETRKRSRVPEQSYSVKTLISGYLPDRCIQKMRSRGRRGEGSENVSARGTTYYLHVTPTTHVQIR